jgi:hypothetical protein
MISANIRSRVSSYILDDAYDKMGRSRDRHKLLRMDYVGLERESYDRVASMFDQPQSKPLHITGIGSDKGPFQWKSGKVRSRFAL